jgi:hypothetical protein
MRKYLRNPKWKAFYKIVVQISIKITENKKRIVDWKRARYATRDHRLDLERRPLIG